MTSHFSSPFPARLSGGYDDTVLSFSSSQSSQLTRLMRPLSTPCRDPIGLSSNFRSQLRCLASERPKRLIVHHYLLGCLQVLVCWIFPLLGKNQTQFVFHLGSNTGRTVVGGPCNSECTRLIVSRSLQVRCTASPQSM